MAGIHPGQAGCGKVLVATDSPPHVLKGLHMLQVSPLVLEIGPVSRRATSSIPVAVGPRESRNVT